MVQWDMAESKKKKEFKRIDWDVVKRLLLLLYYDTKIKRTNLAMKANMSYAKCTLYIDWLEMLDLVMKESDTDNSEVVRLSGRGREIYERKYKTVQNVVIGKIR